jgi:hypothetical protein
VNSNKGLISFWLLLFFITATSARNFVTLFQDIHKGNNHSKEAKCILSAADESDLGTISLKDSDVDDVEFTYYGNYISKKHVILPAEKHNFIPETEHFSAYKIPLYDLYCNWKFHLS